jgi:hypothetical protein
VFVGLGSAVVVTTLGRRPLAWAARQLSRFSDPLVAAAGGRIAAVRRLAARR